MEYVRPSAFVIQPFDNGGKYDKRFDEIIRPTLESIGLHAYRVDRDDHAKVLIEDIKARLSSAAIVICEISEDNPNVWFELGFAIALDRECVMICSAIRDVLPFDIRHQRVIFYKTDGPSDFITFQDKLKRTIEARIKKIRTLEAPKKPTTFPRLKRPKTAEENWKETPF